MLTLIIRGGELYDSKLNKFVNVKDATLQLEHSLISVSKWESKWEKPFLTKETKSLAETRDYVRCMTMSSNVEPIIYDFLTPDHISAVANYIDAAMTATTFRKDKSAPPNREIMTSEIIYYWMIAYTIPFSCEKWHLNRLLTLINVCNEKNKPQKKLTQAQIEERNKARTDLNAARLAKYHTTG